MDSTNKDQEKATRYYDQFSKFYDWVSSDSYYRKPRTFAVQCLELSPRQTILNIPCGTGQNFRYFQEKMKNTGLILGVDLSEGMLNKARKKVQKNHWSNIQIIQGDATELNLEWVNKKVEQGLKFDSILCDLGLSGFPDWKKVIDQLLELLKPKGKLVVMDWYINEPNFRGKFIKWIGKGEVNRKIFQYMEGRVNDFSVDRSFKNGEMFVAVGTRKS